jgi:hypothetical protein
MCKSGNESVVWDGSEKERLVCGKRIDFVEMEYRAVEDEGGGD